MDGDQEHRQVSAGLPGVSSACLLALCLEQPFLHPCMTLSTDSLALLGVQMHSEHPRGPGQQCSSHTWWLWVRQTTLRGCLWALSACAGAALPLWPSGGCSPPPPQPLSTYTVLMGLFLGPPGAIFKAVWGVLGHHGHQIIHLLLAARWGIKVIFAAQWGMFNSILNS